MRWGHRHDGGACRSRIDLARALPRPEAPLRQCGRSVPAAAAKANILTACPTPTSIPCSRSDKPVIFNFHGYPLLIHRLTYRRHNHDNIHVRGYKEKGNINTPLELAI